MDSETHYLKTDRFQGTHGSQSNGATNVVRELFFIPEGGAAPSLESFLDESPVELAVVMSN